MNSTRANTPCYNWKNAGHIFHHLKVQKLEILLAWYIITPKHFTEDQLWFLLCVKDPAIYIFILLSCPVAAKHSKIDSFGEPD